MVVIGANTLFISFKTNVLLLPLISLWGKVIVVVVDR